MLNNQVELWEFMLACIKLRVVMVPTTTQMTSGDLEDRVTPTFPRLTRCLLRLALPEPHRGGTAPAMESGMSTHYVRIIESNMARPAVYPVEAIADASEMLAGCVRGEGRVEVWSVDPRTTYGDPIKVLEA